MEEDQTSNNIPAEPNKETSPSPLQVNISEDDRFINLISGESSPDSLEAQMLAMDKFQQQFPEDYSQYEEKSIWYDDEGVPDIREDLFYKKLEADYEGQIKDKLLAIGGDSDDPDARLTAMGQSYEKIRFETAMDTFQDYKERFPEKTKTYTDTEKTYNVHLANFDQYANERLQNIPDKYSPTAMAFYKAIATHFLGEESPKVGREKVSFEFYNALAGDMGKRGGNEGDWKKKLEEWLKQLVG